MRRKTFLFLLCLQAFMPALQAQEGWYTGVSLSPFQYFLYNYDDWNPQGKEHSTDLRVVPPQLFVPNGFQAALMLGNQWSDHFGAGMNVGYSYQKQAFNGFFPTLLHTGEGGLYEVEVMQIETRLQYLHFSPFIEGLIRVDDFNHFFCAIGMNLSFLLGYSEEIDHDLTPAGTPIDMMLKWENGEYMMNWVDHGVETSRELRIDWGYRRLVAGSFLNMGYRHFFSELYALDIGLWGSYDWSNAENFNGFLYFGDGTTYDLIDIPHRWYRWGNWPDRASRPPTRNIRLGVCLAFRVFLY